jgi:transposase
MSKRFSEQFKQEAVGLISAERSISEVANQLGVGYSTLDKWVRAHRRHTGQLAALNQEQKRIRELERQVAHLQEVNDILKKATVYFANPANR